MILEKVSGLKYKHQSPNSGFFNVAETHVLTLLMCFLQNIGYRPLSWLNSAPPHQAPASRHQPHPSSHLQTVLKTASPKSLPTTTEPSVPPLPAQHHHNVKLLLIATTAIPRRRRPQRRAEPAVLPLPVHEPGLLDTPASSSRRLRIRQPGRLWRRSPSAELCGSRFWCAGRQWKDGRAGRVEDRLGCGFLVGRV